MSITEPVQTFPPRMIDAMERPVETVWAVTDVEIDELRWAVPLLQKQWPRLTEDAISFWFRNAISDRYTKFVRTKNVVGMASYDTSVKEPWPIVRENFLRAREGYDTQEPLFIHRRFAEWAVSLGAKEYVFKLDSDRVGTTQAIREMLRKLPGVISVQPDEYYVAALRE